MPHPVLAMPMWEGVGDRALDYSGHGNHGTFFGDPEWVVDGVHFITTNRVTHSRSVLGLNPLT